MEPTHQFTLGLGKVEGSPVGFADHGCHVDQEGRQEEKDVPGTLLGADDAGRGHRAGVEEDCGEGQPHCYFVGDDLRGRSKCAQ